MKIAIIGAGNVGGSIGRALARVGGHEIRFGVRSPDKIVELVAECGDSTSATGIADAVAFADIVFLTTPWQVTLDVVRSVPDWNGTILADCTNPIGWDNGPITLAEVHGTSAAQMIAEAAAGARVVKAFSTHGFAINLNPTVGGVTADHYTCGDSDEAKATLNGLVAEMGFHPVDAGPLRNAAALEHLAVLWVHLAGTSDAGRNFVFKMQRG